ncbi:unnamed protein product [Calypogeia fissa]
MPWTACNLFGGVSYCVRGPTVCEEEEAACTVVPIRHLFITDGVQLLGPAWISGRPPEHLDSFGGRRIGEFDGNDVSLAWPTRDPKRGSREIIIWPAWSVVTVINFNQTSSILIKEH